MNESLFETLQFMKIPAVACLLLSGLLVYLGLHIVRREVIFVDLALAQVATLGTCLALLMNIDPHSWKGYAMSFGFTLVGAAAFSLTRNQKNHRVPQEALIGIIYVVAAAASILMLSASDNPHGSEELKETLVGDPLHLQNWKQIQTPLLLFLGIAVVHFVFRKKFFAISFDHEQAATDKIAVGWWDFLFYALFGLVVTTFVQIGGVLLVFSYLIIPAVCANFLAMRLGSLLLLGIAFASCGTAGGVLCSAKFQWPMGAAIVCVLGVLLMLTMIFTKATARKKGA